MALNPIVVGWPGQRQGRSVLTEDSFPGIAWPSPVEVPDAVSASPPKKFTQTRKTPVVVLRMAWGDRTAEGSFRGGGRTGLPASFRSRPLAGSKAWGGVAPDSLGVNLVDRAIHRALVVLEGFLNVTRRVVHWWLRGDQLPAEGAPHNAAGG